MKKIFIRLVYKELMSIINRKSPVPQKKEVQLIDYFKIVRNNLLYAFQKIRKEYERD